MTDGIIPVYKERGFTSFDVVAKLRGIFSQKKIGHTGTLDPEATGVLVVCLGKATKLVDMLTDERKTYEAHMLLGRETDTQDIWGSTVKESGVCVTPEEVRTALLSFVGKYDQIPPMYSALKKDGKKLYELAREGKTVERQPRRVEIYGIDIIKDFDPSVNEAVFSVSCSKGTYIRTLIHDTGTRLGCGACMSALKRTRAAGFTLEDCVTLSGLQEAKETGTLDSLVIGAEKVFEGVPKLVVKEEADRLLKNGNKIFTDMLYNEEDGSELRFSETCMYRVYDSRGKFCAVYETTDLVKDGLKIKYNFM